MTIEPQDGDSRFNTDQAKDLMSGRGWLSQTPEEFRNAILRRCRLVNFQKGEPVYTLDGGPGGIYGLVSGRASVSLAPQERGPYPAHVMHPGNWFGLASAVGRQSRTVGLTAIQDSQFLLLPITEFEDVIAKVPDAWRHFVALALINSNIAISAADDLLIRDPVKRCVATLLRLADIRHSSQAKVSPIDVDVTQEDLAHLSNLSRNSTGTILRSLSKRGLLHLVYKQIRISDPNALRAMLKDGH